MLLEVPADLPNMPTDVPGDARFLPVAERLDPRFLKLVRDPPVRDSMLVPLAHEEDEFRPRADWAGRHAAIVVPSSSQQ